jgi:methionyl-tRNA formyltransferase
MRIVFIGTTDFAIPTLNKLKSLHEIVFVVTAPDKPAGRTQTVKQPAIKTWAIESNIPLSQPVKIAEAKEDIRSRQPDLILVAAYGQIIPKEILDLAKLGSFNIHPSLLPKYRGATPIPAAILNGDEETGVTIIKMDEKMDHGQIVAQSRAKIDDQDDLTTLSKKLSQLTADILPKILDDLERGTAKLTEQNHSAATFTKQFRLEDGRIDWTAPAKYVERQVKALSLNPGVWSKLDDRIYKFFKVKMVRDQKIELPGKLYRLEGLPAVKCSENSIMIEEIQPEGKKIMPGRDFLNGVKNLDNKIFV